MGDGPEQEQDGKPAGDGAHEIHGAGGGMGAVAEKDDKKAAHHHEKRCAGGMWDLEFVGAGDELAAIPEAAGSLHGHHENGTCDHPHDPAHDIIHPVKLHIFLIFGRGFFSRAKEGYFGEISGN